MPEKPRSQPRPFEATALETLFAPLRHHAGCVIAVSGGADSLALLHAVARWRRAFQPHIILHAVTVDHGLRAGSGNEAAFVAEVSARLGIPHATLSWMGDKPRSGLQSAAREARYALMRTFAAENGLSAIVTAHTLDDQAETLLMRLARGSGLDGLAGITPVSRCGDVVIIRPLLDISKSRLKAFLRSISERWIEDPSNQDVRFERIRIRRTLAALRTQGFDARAIALSAKRLGRARAASAAATLDLASSAVEVFPEGWGRVDMTLLKAAPVETALGVLSKALAGFGSGARVVRLSKLEALWDALVWQDHGKWTLGGCVLRLDASQLTIIREVGRTPAPDILLAPGETALWDGRFRVSSKLPESVRVAALGVEGLRAIDAPRPKIPKVTLQSTPAFWLNGRMIAAPLASFSPAEPGHALVCRATFVHPFDDKI